jgi:hypothetical protein
MQDFEKLGLFYLGRTYDVATRKAGEALVLYDSRDLVTHAVCVGMTGSGKTGLCISLLEEAAIDQIPAIAVDVKGDLANLLLTFPELRGEDFAPWVDEGEARKQGITPAQLGEKTAEVWKKGLAEWGQDGARIKMLRDSAEFRVYTPGSQAGLPVSILKSFAAPPPVIRDDPEALGERVATTADSLLGLLGVNADPMQSREHILVSNILSASWKEGKDLELSSLIPLIQSPPFRRVGVIELDAFYPAKERFALSLKLNNLLASPSFEGWVRGEPLDVGAMLNAPSGKPRVSIVSVAHLEESERMFFVSLLLNEVLGWVRSQSGTTSLRALLFMDEIFGYFPPVASPPSKRPLLTLLKQARAFGLGVVLATQNPADLDYKGLSNTGTWFLGRLQAERDKLRVLEGLEGAAASQSAKFDRRQMDTILSGLGKRTFLMHNVHEDHPEVFQVRWALSYLSGPLTRPQIKQLMDPLKAAAPPVPARTPVPAREPAPAKAPEAPAAPAPTLTPAPAPPTSAAGAETSDLRPLLPPEVVQFFVPIRGTQPEGGTLLYRPMIFGFGEVYFNDTKSGVSTTETVGKVSLLSEGAVAFDWQLAAKVGLTPDELEKEPAAAARYESPPPSASKAKSYTAWTKAFVDVLYRTETIEVLKSPSLGAWSSPSETERDFRLRLQQAAKEERDARLEQLRAKYSPKIMAIEDKIRRAEEVVAREAAQARSAGFTSLIKLGTTVLDAVVARKKLSKTAINKAGAAIRDAGQSVKESSDASRAKSSLESLRRQYDDLQADFDRESKDVVQKTNPLTEPLESVTLKPKKTNITPKLVALVWAPYWADASGRSTSAWE